MPLVVRLEPPSFSGRLLYRSRLWVLCAPSDDVRAQEKLFSFTIIFFIRSTRPESWKLGRALFNVHLQLVWFINGELGKLQNLLCHHHFSTSTLRSVVTSGKMWIIVWVSICGHPWELLVVISSFSTRTCVPDAYVHSRARYHHPIDRRMDESDLHRIAHATVNVHALSYTLSLSFTVDNTPNSRKRRKTMCVM